MIATICTSGEELRPSSPSPINLMQTQTQTESLVSSPIGLLLRECWTESLISATVFFSGEWLLLKRQMTVRNHNSLAVLCISLQSIRSSMGPTFDQHRGSRRLAQEQAESFAGVRQQSRRTRERKYRPELNLTGHLLQLFVQNQPTTMLLLLLVLCSVTKTRSCQRGMSVFCKFSVFFFPLLMVGAKEINQSQHEGRISGKCWWVCFLFRFFLFFVFWIGIVVVLVLKSGMYYGVLISGCFWVWWFALIYACFGCSKLLFCGWL